MLEFRCPRHPDIDALCRLKIRAGVEKNGDTYRSDDMRQEILGYLYNDTKEMLQQKNYKVIVAKDHDTLLGYALYHTKFNNQGTGTHMIVIDDLYSLGSKKQRVGGRLLEKICAMEPHISHITLQTKKEAIKFYQKMGFVEAEPQTEIMHLYGENLQRLRQKRQRQHHLTAA
ncbi:MAG TPA: GNAT family N-acetyltransferase [Alphaproteobacteria bacterium]